MYATEDRQQITSDAEAKATGSTDVELWLKKIKAAQDEEKDWRERAQQAILVYEADQKANTHFNLFHSNVQTTLPALYNSTPSADVRRRFSDKDPVGKMAVNIVERSIAYSLDQYPFDKYTRAAIKDGEVTGRGTVRIRLNNELEGGQVSYAEVKTEPVKWDKWGRGPGRFWEELPFIYFEHDLDQEDVTELVGNQPKKLAYIKLHGFGDGENKDKVDAKTAKGVYKTLKVYEIWDKRRREILFIAESIKDFPLKVEQDVLGLKDFFPVPPPLQPIERLGNLTPVTPYDVFQHLIAELDRITKRINKLVNQLKVRGLISSEMASDFEALRSADDGQYLSAKNATQFVASGGGLEKAIAHWPMEPTVAALKQLIEQREQIKQLIYEVTGISDILRGATDARETLGAQKIKTQWGSLRLQDRQAEVARFCRDIFRLKTELISKFPPQVISIMTSLPQKPEEQEVFGQALQMLGDNLTRRFRIDVETDSTVRADLSRNQEIMNQFMMTTGQFVQGLQQAAMIAPQMLPAMIEVYLSFARQFKLGKQAEDAIESLSQMGEQLAQMALQQQQQPNPEEVKAKLEAEREEKKLQIFERTEAAKLRFAEDKHKLDIQAQREKFAMEQEREDWRVTNENARAQQQFDFDTQRGSAEEERATREHERRMQMTETEHGARMTEATTKNKIAMREAGIPEEGTHATRDEAAVLAEGLQLMAQEQREATQATLSVVTQLVEQLTGHMAEQTKTTREIAAQNMKIATAPRRLKRNSDGTKETELVL